MDPIYIKIAIALIAPLLGYLFIVLKKRDKDYEALRNYVNTILTFIEVQKEKNETFRKDIETNENDLKNIFKDSR